MQRFHFHLEQVARLRDREEERRRLDLGLATRRVEEVQQGIADLADKQRSQGWTSFDPAWLAAREAFFQKLHQDRQRLTEALDDATRRRQAAARVWQQAHQQAEVLHRVRERREAEFDLDQRRREDADLDDVAETHRRLDQGRLVRPLPGSPVESSPDRGRYAGLPDPAVGHTSG